MSKAKGDEQFELLLKNSPHFHTLPDGSSINYSVHKDTLRYLYGSLSEGMSTIETGAGQTTIVFAIAGTKHTCISPSPNEIERIKSYMSGNGIENNVIFQNKPSQIAMTQEGVIPAALDFVFLDGAHRFPIPMLDWYFTEPKLKVGGIVGVDNFEIPSVRILYDFLMIEDEWELVKEMYTTAFFRKIAESNKQVDWVAQKINKPLVDKMRRK